MPLHGLHLACKPGCIVRTPHISPDKCVVTETSIRGLQKIEENVTVIRDDFDVDLVDSCGSDEFICKAARVSTLGAASLESSESKGLINFLMKNRHGSPFEHGMMTFRISAPIFVWREFMRHRIGFSYNEQSGRYMVLDPVFYIPNTRRPLIQIGKPGAYNFIEGSNAQDLLVKNLLLGSYTTSWENYMSLLANDVAKEVARMCLPVAIYSTAYVTCNPRSMMSFLSLRTKDPFSTFPSYPQWEINQVANKMEVIFQELFPLTADTFHNLGRVSP